MRVSLVSKEGKGETGHNFEIGRGEKGRRHPAKDRDADHAKRIQRKLFSGKGELKKG